MSPEFRYPFSNFGEYLLLLMRVASGHAGESQQQLKNENLLVTKPEGFKIGYNAAQGDARISDTLDPTLNEYVAMMCWAM